jgi:hypothetical protein
VEGVETDCENTIRVVPILEVHRRHEHPKLRLRYAYLSHRAREESERVDRRGKMGTAKSCDQRN